MRKIVLCHFFNEEYLLPWWLLHHRKYFDHGIMINYGSWDRSVEIIRELCPTWEIIDSRNEFFDARKCEDEIIELESRAENNEAWKVTLNVTEFLVGDYRLLNDRDVEWAVKSILLVDKEPGSFPTYDKPIWEQKTDGFLYDINLNPRQADSQRHARIIHRRNVMMYNSGRHYGFFNTDQLAIIYTAWSPWNVRMKMRRLQIGAKTRPDELLDWQVDPNKSLNFTPPSVMWQVYPHNMYPPFFLEKIHLELKKDAVDVSHLIKYYIDLMENPVGEPRVWKRDYDENKYKEGGYVKSIFEIDRNNEFNDSGSKLM